MSKRNDQRVISVWCGYVCVRVTSKYGKEETRPRRRGWTRLRGAEVVGGT